MQQFNAVGMNGLIPKNAMSQKVLPISVHIAACFARDCAGTLQLQKACNSTAVAACYHSLPQACTLICHKAKSNGLHAVLPEAVAVCLSSISHTPQSCYMYATIWTCLYSFQCNKKCVDTVLNAHKSRLLRMCCRCIRSSPTLRCFARVTSLTPLPATT